MSAVIELADVSVVRGGNRLLEQRHLDGRGGRALGHSRPERRRQDHAAADPQHPALPEPRASSASSAR